MKQHACFALLIWLALAIEQAKPQLCPTYSCLLPAIATWILLTQSAVAVCLSGTALIVHNILRSDLMPWAGIICLLLCAFLTHQPQPKRRNAVPGAAPSRWRHSDAFRISVATFFTLAWVIAEDVHRQAALPWTVLKQYAFVSLPIIAITGLLLKAAEELGFRRSIQ